MLLCGTLVTAANAQTAAQTAPPPQRAIAMEEAVARSITEARAHAHFRRLSRIADRTALRQIVCMAAATGSSTETLLAQESEAASVLFPAGEPQSLAAALAPVADYDDRRSAGGRRITRISVAAFTSPSAPAQTWVGVALYWSRATEYFALHLTRSYQLPSLAGNVAPACAAVR